MTTSTRSTACSHARRLLMAAILAATTFAVHATPTDLPRPPVLTPERTNAYACASGPSFQGWITDSTSSHPRIDTSTTGSVYGYISNVVDNWSCTAWYRYDGLVWARNSGGSKGNFSWGNLIHSTSVACNWAIGSTDYLKANSTNNCPSSDAQYAHQFFLGNTGTGSLLQAIYHQDASPDEPGDFAFIHSDCEAYYGSAPTSWDVNFNSTNQNNRPGTSLCDPFDIDGTNNEQSIVVDNTKPTGSSISIAAGAAYTQTSSVTLGSIAATDNLNRTDFGGGSRPWRMEPWQNIPDPRATERHSGSIQQS